MDWISITIIAIGLSMDSFAVSIGNGLSLKKLNFKNIFFISFSLAFFQALFPLIGWLAGREIEHLIKEIDHWIAFILLLGIGGKMIYEGITHKEEDSPQKISILLIISQSIATSIDALAVGISFALLDISIITTVIIIGGVTHFFSFVGMQLGKYFNKKSKFALEIFGGLVLIGIGIKILIEHIYFH